MILSLYPAAEQELLGRLVRLIGVGGALLMVAAMVLGTSRMVSWAAVVLVVQYGVSLIPAPSVDRWAPLFAAGVFLMTESAYFSLEQRGRLPGPRSPAFRELLRVFGITAVVIGAGTGVLALASLPVPSGLLVQAAGVGAAAAALTTLTLLVRRRS